MDSCPLCGAPLRWWDRTQPTQCFGCKAMIQPSPPSLFDVVAAEHEKLMTPEPHTLARATDPHTSLAAAKALGGKAGTMRRRLLFAYRQIEELTADEAAEQAGYSAEDGAWKRVSDLLTAGLIEDTGYTRAGRLGRQQRVLRITAAGVEALR